MTREATSQMGRPPTVPGANSSELRRALLTRPAAVSAGAAVLMAAGSAALDSHRLAAAGAALVAGAVVIGSSAVTGLLGVRTAAARAEAVFAAAMASFAVKVLVFGIALGIAGHVGAARRTPFALTAIVAVLVWLAVEVHAVARMRSTGAVVFGPPPDLPAATPAGIADRPVPIAAAPSDEARGPGGDVGGSPGVG